MATANKGVIFTGGDSPSGVTSLGKSALATAFAFVNLSPPASAGEAEAIWNYKDADISKFRVETFNNDWRNYAPAKPQQVQGSGSPAYIATLRRRGIAAILEKLDTLSQHADGPDIAVYTYPIAVGLNSLSNSLIQASTEGGTRELLRRLRNTILDGGWQAYRVHEARQSLKDALAFLIDAEAVAKADVDRITRALEQNGLHPLILPVFEYDTTDGEAETEQVPG